MRTGLLIIWSLCFGITSTAQLYTTQSGKILVNGKYNDENVAAISNHLHIKVNYDRSELYMHLEISTLVSGNDSLNRLLQKLAGADMHFSGKMNINYVQTKSHSKQNFSTTGVLSINGVSIPFSFSSVLEHFPRGNVSCNFNALFTINLNEFGVGTKPGENMVNVNFNQLVFKRPGD